MASKYRKLISAMQDLASVQDSLRGIQDTLREEDYGGFEAAADHIDELMELLQQTSTTIQEALAEDE